METRKNPQYHFNPDLPHSLPSEIKKDYKMILFKVCMPFKLPQNNTFKSKIVIVKWTK